MKRTLATLMALCMMLSLAACGGSGASSVPASVSASAPSSGSEPAPADGAVLNIWCWNDEFQSRFNDYYPEVKAVAEDKSTTTLNDGTIVKWTIKRILAPMGNEVMTLIKDTSLANVIANKEIIMMAKEYSAKGLIWPLFSTALFFLVFVGAMTLLFNWLEKKLSYFR